MRPVVPGDDRRDALTHRRERRRRVEQSTAMMTVRINKTGRKCQAFCIKLRCRRCFRQITNKGNRICIDSDIAFERCIARAIIDDCIADNEVELLLLTGDEKDCR